MHGGSLRFAMMDLTQYQILSNELDFERTTCYQGLIFFVCGTTGRENQRIMPRVKEKGKAGFLTASYH